MPVVVGVTVPPSLPGGVDVAKPGGVAVGNGLGGVAVGGAIDVGAVVGRLVGRTCGSSVGSSVGSMVGGWDVGRMITTGKVGDGNRIGGRVGRRVTRVATAVEVARVVAVAVAVGCSGWMAINPTGGKSNIIPGVRSGPVRQLAAIISSGVIPRALANASIVSPSSTRYDTHQAGAEHSGAAVAF